MRIVIIIGILLWHNVAYASTASTNPPGGILIEGCVTDSSGDAVPYATIFVEGSTLGTTTDATGHYSLRVERGKHTIVASLLGYEESKMAIDASQSTITSVNFALEEQSTAIDEVVVTASGVGGLRRSAFNAVAVDTAPMRNTTKNLSDALARAPGLKLREAGGVGSEMSLSVDGFTGKHVKIFIDGVPQEGVGSSFSLNNIPAGFAERIEVYSGVVPVGFGADAIGGVVNIVTNKARRRWFADASYSYGSFNTHRSSVNAGQTLGNGFMWEINAFQNYSDNNYKVEAPVEDFATGRIERNKLERVGRFHDTYHNEAIVAKVGVVDKVWADRFVIGINYSQMYKEIQTGVRQEIVYGEKLRHGYSLLPSLEYQKRNLLVEGLDLTLTANYNRNHTVNVDTAQYKYNWRGESKRLNSPGEQSHQHSAADNDNWNITTTLNYRINRKHHITLNNVFNTFRRENSSLLARRWRQMLSISRHAKISWVHSTVSRHRRGGMPRHLPSIMRSTPQGQ